MEKHPLTDIPLNMIKTRTLQCCNGVFKSLGHIITKNLIIEAQTPKEVYTMITEQLVASDNIHLFPALIDLITDSTGVISFIRDDFVNEIEEICISSDQIINASPDNLHLRSVKNVLSLRMHPRSNLIVAMPPMKITAAV